MTKSDRQGLLEYHADQLKGYYWASNDRSKAFYANKMVAASEVCEMFGITRAVLDRNSKLARRDAAS